MYGECEWSSVVKAGQNVKVKMKDKFVGVVVEKSLFSQAKLASILQLLSLSLMVEWLRRMKVQCF